MKTITLLFSIMVLSSLLFVGATATEYDPWLDQDSDGDIDIFDVVPAASAYGTRGDSTKSVTITNWPSLQDVNIANWPTNTNVTIGNVPINVTITGHATKLLIYESGSLELYGESYYTPTISIDGYTKMTLLIVSNTDTNAIRIWSKTYSDIVFEEVANFPNYWMKTYDVMTPLLQIQVRNWETFVGYFTIEIYLVA